MSPVRQAILLGPRFGWRTGTAAGVTAADGQAMQLAGGAPAAPPRWLAGPYLLGRDGWIRRYDWLTARLSRVLDVADFGVTSADAALAAAGDDLYLLDPDPPRLLVFAARGYLRDVIRRDPAQAWARVAAENAALSPGVTVDTRGDVQFPARPGRVDRDGRPACRPPDTALTRPTLDKQGYWVSDQLDSHVYQCDWHRVRLTARRPDATKLTVSTYTQETPATAAEIAALDPGTWRPGGPVRNGDNDLLILSASARYLWVRLDLAGDGYSSPSVDGLRLEYPRHSYLRFLPAVYSADPGSADFLARFLAIAQTSVEDIEARLAAMPALFEPKAVPDAFVSFLAGWLDVPVEGTWTPAQQRQLIDAAKGYLRTRGTPAAIRQHVAAYLTSMSGVTLPADGLPQLVEGFQQRRYLTLPAGGSARHPLWSPAAAGRARLDRHDRLGQVRLTSVRDPDLDLFTRHAHRFSVYVPAALAPRPEDRQMLRRAIAAEAPAHVAADLVLVRPAMCLGRQSQLGIDSLLAAPAPIRLASSRLGPLAVLGNARTSRDWRLPKEELP
jgi:phage tail-like protein